MMLATPPGRKRLGHAGERRRRIDHVEHTVDESDVEGRRAEHIGQRLDVALDGPDAIGHSGLGRAARQGGQRVDADVDDGDGRPELGERNREPAGAAAAVEDRRPTADVSRRNAAAIGLTRDTPNEARMPVTSRSSSLGPAVEVAATRLTLARGADTVPPARPRSV